MRITSVAVMIMVAAASVWAGVRPAEARQLTVCMQSVAGTGNAFIENEARRVVSSIFVGIGVQIQWRGSSKCPSNAIYISFSSKIPAAVHATALAYALPYEGTHIAVFLDRVRDMNRSAAGRLLGYTLAHEITHILEGVARHSPSGIMKARWELHDHDLMRAGRLGFAPEDVDLIYRGLDARESRLVASASVVQK
jgi:hypothetical protein